MQKVTTISEIRKAIKQYRQQGQSIAFVPTMGNLHAGHLKLVAEARKKADRVIVSIFVNPTQFGVGEDFESYPRTHLEDSEKLKKAGADILFLPTVFEIYPDKTETTVSVGGLSTIHCGAYRAGHFDGVATIVSKLFNIVQPDMAIFGEKDFQQLAVIKQMVKDLNIAVDIIAVATARENDGLAMSSRNGYLTAQQREIAPKLYLTLCQARDRVIQGKDDFQSIEQKCLAELQASGFEVDYFSICRASDLVLASENDHDLVILAAAKLGKPRLIDNVFFSKK